MKTVKKLPVSKLGGRNFCTFVKALMWLNELRNARQDGGKKVQPSRMVIDKFRLGCRRCLLEARPRMLKCIVLVQFCWIFVGPAGMKHVSCFVIQEISPGYPGEYFAVGHIGSESNLFQASWMKAAQ